MACNGSSLVIREIRRHGVPARWLLRFVGNETVAEDLLSDVFFDVWQQAGRFEGRSAVSTWLLSIARLQGALGPSSSDRCGA
jgi:Sigma-70 region 2